MTELIHINHFNQIRASMKPQDGWSGDDWDHHLVDAAVSYMRGSDNFQEYFIVRATRIIGNNPVYATSIMQKMAWTLDKERATQFKIDRKGKASPIQEFLDQFKPIESFVTDIVLEKYHSWMVKDMYIDEI